MLIKTIRRLVGSRLSPKSKKRILRLRRKLSIKQWQAEKSADVVLVSFPKCGRTWLRLMVGRAIQQHFGLEEVNLLELEQWVERHPAIPKILVTHDDDPHYKKPAKLVESKAKYKNKKVIFLVRDPRDVVVSIYFQKKKREKTYDGELSDYLHEPVGSFDTLLRFYNIWAENRHVPKAFLLVRYEDIYANPQNELRRVLDFLGLQAISDGVIAEAVSYAFFDNMRRMEEEDEFDSGKLRPKDRSDKESYKTRKGEVGGFAEYLNANQIEYLNRKINETLSDFYGYQSPLGVSTNVARAANRRLESSSH